MNYKIVAGLAVLLVAGAGIFFLSPLSDGQDREMDYGDLRSEARDSSYRVSYDVSFSRQLSGGMFSYERLDLYSSEGLQRQEMSWSSDMFNGTVSQVNYLSGNNSVRCEMSGEDINYSSCMVAGSDFDFFHDVGKRADKLGLNITSRESQEILERECRRFSFEASSNSTGFSRVEGPVRYDACLDKEKGYVAALSVTGNLTPIMGGEPAPTTLVDMEASEADTGFDGGVRPSFSFEASADCFWVDPYVKVMTFEDIDQAQVEISGENHSFQLGDRYEISRFNLPEDELAYGQEKDITVHAGGEKASATCLYQELE